MSNYDVDRMENFKNGEDTTVINVRINNDELNGMIKWAKFKAVMEIIFGVLYCLAILPAVFGVPQIISGVKLLNSVSALRQYMHNNQEEKAIEYFIDNKRFFLLSGVSTIIRLVFSLLLFILYAGLIAFFMVNVTEMPEFNGIIEQYDMGTTFFVNIISKVSNIF